MSNRPLVVGEYGRVKSIMRGIERKQQGFQLTLVSDLYMEEMAYYQGRIGKVTALEDSPTYGPIAILKFDDGLSWQFRVRDVSWESPYFYSLQLQDDVERGLLTLAH